jgi:hypothetical protein
VPDYLVTWQIDIEADNPTEAAAKALIMQRDNDPANTATVFNVQERMVCGFPAEPIRVDTANSPATKINKPAAISRR